MPVFGFGSGQNRGIIASAAMKAAIAGRQRGHKGPQPVAHSDTEREEAGLRRDTKRKQKVAAGKRIYQQK